MVGYNKYKSYNSESGDEVYYMAEVVQLLLDRAPYGVLVQILEREDESTSSSTNLEKKTALVRKSELSPVVASLRLGEIVRIYRIQTKASYKLEAKLAPARIWKEIEDPTNEEEISPTNGMKPLLILDLNGVICDRGTYASRRHDRNSVTRPYALDFLSWCFANFEVAVWSCGKRENMELELFQGRTIVFAWDQTRSTSLWPRCSAVSADKPLFLKEIQHVWKPRKFQPPAITGKKKSETKIIGPDAMSWRRAATQPPPVPAKTPPPPRSFGPQDTILLDNHYEKFERNQVGNNIIITTWTREESSDTALARTGTLVQLLTKYTTVPDAAAFGKEQALEILPDPAPDAYVPGAKLIALAKEAQEDLVCGKKEQKSTSPRFGGNADTEDDTDISRILIERYCASEIHQKACPEYTATRYLKTRDSPGPRARPLRRRDLPLITEEGYALTEKTDGERGWFLACERGVFLLRRDLTLAARPLKKHQFLTKSTTILDGEVAFEDKLFVVFDAVRVLDEDIGADGSNGAPGRLSLAAKKLKIQGTGINVGAWRVAAKRYWTIDDDDLQTIARQVSSAGAFVDESRANQSDGLILTRLDDSDYSGYYASQCFKFKPIITLDIRLVGLSKWFDHNRKIIQAMLSAKKGSNSFTLPAIDAAVAGERGSELIISSVMVSADKLSLLFDSSGNLVSTKPIAECVYENGNWFLVRLRLDKRLPNSIRTAWAVLESIADRLSVDQVLDAMQSGRVAAHYDKIQRKRKTQALMDEAMYRLRRLNNLVKALSLETAINFYNSTTHSCLFNLHRAKSYEHESTQQVLETLRAPVTEELRRNFKTKRGRRAVVVELGCGRGGDLGKWKQSIEIDKLVAVDISTESIAEAHSRWKKMVRNGDHEFVQADFAAPGFSVRLREQLLKQKSADFIACHFAMHYAFGTSERLAELLDAISSSLSNGGIFLATIINWTELYAMLESGTSIGDLCSVSASPQSIAAMAKLPLNDAIPHIAGIQYTFSLGDAVEECDEFLIHTPTLQALAKQRGLSLMLAQPFPDFLVEAHTRDPTAFSKLAADMGVRPKNTDNNKDPLSEDQFRVASLYAVLIFRRDTDYKENEISSPSTLTAEAEEWTPASLIKQSS